MIFPYNIIELGFVSKLGKFGNFRRPKKRL